MDGILQVADSEKHFEDRNENNEHEPEAEAESSAGRLRPIHDQSDASVESENKNRSKFESGGWGGGVSRGGEEASVSTATGLKEAEEEASMNLDESMVQMIVKHSQVGVSLCTEV